MDSALIIIFFWILISMFVHVYKEEQKEKNDYDF